MVGGCIPILQSRSLKATQKKKREKDVFSQVTSMVLLMTNLIER